MRSSKVTGSESGLALVEALVALGILGLTAATFISGLATTAKADLVINEQTKAEGIARSQMDDIKGQGYIDFSVVGHGYYTLIPAPTNYSIGIATVPINPADGQPLPSGQDNGVQKITVSVNHQSRQIFTLENYKVHR